MEIHLRSSCLVAILTTLLSSFSYAWPRVGANFSYTLLATSPGPLRGYQIMLDYYPELLHWGFFEIYFDSGYSYFKASHARNHTVVNIYSAAPVFRFSPYRIGCVLPYLELSIGFSYLNHTYLDRRNQGIHFAFQDRMGVGALIGASEHLSLGLHAVHYSNARLSSHNSGITIPLELDIGYRF